MPWLDAPGSDAEWHESSVVPFDVADRGLLLADGVFDTALVLGGRVAWGSRHRARLLAHCRAIGIDLDPARIERAHATLAARSPNGAARLTVTRGAGPRGLAPPRDAAPVLVATVAPLNRAVLFASMVLSESATRRNETAPSSRIKSLAYLDGVLAMRDAVAAGCDDALFLDTQGHVACTTAANVFAVVGGQLITPRRENGAMDGIVRGVLLETCEGIGLEPVKRALTLAELKAADAVFVTNSLRLVAPVRAIGGSAIATTLEAAALIAHVAAAVRDETGIDPRSLAES